MLSQLLQHWKFSVPFTIVYPIQIFRLKKTEMNVVEVDLCLFD